ISTTNVDSRCAIRPNSNVGACAALNTDGISITGTTLNGSSTSSEQIANDNGVGRASCCVVSYVNCLCYGISDVAYLNRVRYVVGIHINSTPRLEAQRV